MKGGYGGLGLKVEPTAAEAGTPLKGDDAEAARPALWSLIKPTPQVYKASSGGAHADVTGWVIGASMSVSSVATGSLANATQGTIASGVKSLPTSKYIAVGLPSEDKALASLAKAAGVKISAKAGLEGYALSVTADSILVIANSAAGAFFGVQSVLQLAQQPSAVPACRVDDWPDFPIRGAYMYGGPRIQSSSCSEILEWNKKLVDWMSSRKMNFGVVVNQGFYGEVPGLEADKTLAAKMRKMLQELQAYMVVRTSSNPLSASVWNERRNKLADCCAYRRDMCCSCQRLRLVVAADLSISTPQLLKANGFAI